MSKVRINDLARELEVKSKAILDVLPKVGVTEKKTHSSSIEVDEAERVRKHFAGQGSASAARDGGSRTGEPEIKTKIDLSHISKPGDVANLLRRKTEAPSAPAPKPVAVPPAAVPKTAAPPAVEKTAPPPPPPAPEAPARRVIKPIAPVRPSFAVPAPVPSVPPTAPAKSAPAETAAEHTATPIEPALAAKPLNVPPAQQNVQAAVQVTPPSAPPPSPPAAGSIADASQQQRAQAPTAPVRRLITPQTGPRPVYTAPPSRPAAPRGAQGAPQAGQRPSGGMPVRGQPIFQRRPGMGAPQPGQRAPLPP